MQGTLLSLVYIILFLSHSAPSTHLQQLLALLHRLAVLLEVLLPGGCLLVLGGQGLGGEDEKNDENLDKARLWKGRKDCGVAASWVSIVHRQLRDIL